jgi:AcrR family transcriptional regulator
MNTDSTSARLQQIISRAGRLFCERGYATADLRAIAEEVDRNVTSLYNYIDSKAHILYLVVRNCTELGEHPICSMSPR